MAQPGQLIDPEMIVGAAGIVPGMKVADLGCGHTGYFVFPMARAVGNGGVVYAIDIQEAVLQSVDSNARTQGLINVHTLQADLSEVGGTRLPDSALDAAFIISNLVDFILFTQMFREAVRLVRPAGRIIIVDWIGGPIPYAPDADHRIEKNVIRGLAAELNLNFVMEFKPGQYFFGLVFEKRG